MITDACCQKKLAWANRLILTVALLPAGHADRSQERKKALCQVTRDSVQLFPPTFPWPFTPPMITDACCQKRSQQEPEARAAEQPPEQPGSLELLLQWNTFILFICRLEAKPNRFRLPPRQATVYENIMVGKKRGSEVTAAENRGCGYSVPLKVAFGQSELNVFQLPPHQATVYESTSRFQLPTAATPSHGLRVYEHIMVTPRHPHSRHPRLNKDLMSDWQETAHDDNCASTPCGTRGIDGCPRCKLKAVQEHLRLPFAKESCMCIEGRFQLPPRQATVYESTSISWLPFAKESCMCIEGRFQLPPRQATVYESTSISWLPFAKESCMCIEGRFQLPPRQATVYESTSISWLPFAKESCMCIEGRFQLPPRQATVYESTSISWRAASYEWSLVNTVQDLAVLLNCGFGTARRYTFQCSYEAEDLGS
ncbi:hypothetical protein AK812_SmicGene42710 [Symbiodinium microadriaticum]|uniref:Uncharacterized protein n=1 Tax=Symbiodinium microadriaticum TaxID=2951 RepID=A0A1Q9C2V6_SYMMI|nr:hypothetical protein AK812_SmicGene42710 [Symbiodinium microadriaticum]